MKRSALHNFLKGGAIGASMLIPGISGGTAAIFLGIYDDLLRAVSRFAEDKKKNACFLLQVGLGGILGMGLLAKWLLWVVTAYPLSMTYLLLGAIGGTIPTLIKKAGVCRPRLRDLLCLVCGAAVVFGVAQLPQMPIDLGSAGWGGSLLLFLAGFPIASALVLPGISVSYLLLILGLYPMTLAAIADRQFLFLAPLGLGVAMGVLLTARLLETALTRFPRVSYLAIAGFVAGSAVELIPALPRGGEWGVAILCGAAGFLAVFLPARIRKKETAKSKKPPLPNQEERMQ